MIVVVDSGGANLNSILYAFHRIGADALLTSDPDIIFKSSKIILPGVGAAGIVMKNLREKSLDACLRECQQPVLGICLGMQILFSFSEEGNTDCLGVMNGSVRALESANGRPVPHMGWNKTISTRPQRLLSEEGKEEYFYFVHSYVAPQTKEVCAVTNYGEPIPAIVEHNNWFGVQFHPERSGAAGQNLLQRFLNL